MARNEGRAPGSANEPPTKVSSGPAAGGATAATGSAGGKPSAGSPSGGASRPSGSPTGGAGPGSASVGKPSTGGGGGDRAAGPPPSSGGGGGGWLKGLIGGLVGGAAAWAGINYGLEQPTPQIEKLQAQIDAVAAGGGGGGTAFDPSALTAKIDDLEAKVSQGQGGGGPAEAELQAIQSSVGKAEQRIAAVEADLASAAGDGGTDLKEALGAIENGLKELSSRVDKVETSVASGTGDSDTAQQVAALSTAVDGLKGDVENEIKGLSGQVDGIQGKVEGFADRLEALSSRLEALEAELKSTKARLDQAGVQQNSAAAIALAAGRVRQALLAGEPYAEELKPLTSIAEQDPAVKQALEGLQPAAESGVPTMAELRTSFHEIANDIVHEAQAPDGDHPLNRAAGTLMKLVSVRAIGGDVEGDDPEAIVARTEAKLQADDLDAALAELDGMAELPKAAVAWRERAQARLQALEAQEQLEVHAADLLAGTRS